MADFIVPSADYFSIPADDIRFLTSDLTVVGGRVVYGERAFADLAPPAPPMAPSWSPVKRYGGYHVEKDIQDAVRIAGKPCACAVHGKGGVPAWVRAIPTGAEDLFWTSLGCSCWL